MEIEDMRRIFRETSPVKQLDAFSPRYRLLKNAKIYHESAGHIYREHRSYIDKRDNSDFLNEWIDYMATFYMTATKSELRFGHLPFLWYIATRLNRDEYDFMTYHLKFQPV